MSEAELDALIAKTLDFDAWNASECSNADFMIRVDELPPAGRDAGISDI